jgi:hypothetical protein
MIVILSLIAFATGNFDLGIIILMLFIIIDE